MSERRGGSPEVVEPPPSRRRWGDCLARPPETTSLFLHCFNSIPAGTTTNHRHA